MATQGTDYEILLKMRADMAQAMNALNGVQQQLRKTSDSAGAASKAASAAAKSIDSIGTRASAVGSSLKKMAGALVTAFAVRELAGFVQSVIDLDAQLGDMSKKVGVSTETLSALGQVARRNGSDLDAVKTGFVQLAKAATDSSSKGAKALQAMGIPLKQFLALKPADQFDLVAQKFAGYEDGARKAALATALFGKTGADLIPTLNQVGQQGLQNMTDKAIAAGTAVGKDAVAAAQALQSALQTLKEKFAGAANELLVDFRPQIDHFAELIADPDFQQKLKDTAANVASIGAAAVTVSEKIAAATHGLEGFLAWRFGGAVSDDSSFQAAFEKRDELLKELQAREAGRGTLAKAGNWVKGVFESTFTDKAAALQSVDQLRDHINILNEQIQRYQRSKQQLDLPTTGGNADDGKGKGTGQPPIIGDAGAAAAKLARDAANAQAQLTQSLIDLQGQLDPTAAIYAKFNATVKQATDEAELAKKAHGANAQAIDEQKQAVIDLAARVRDVALDQLADKDRQAWEALKRSFETPAQVAVDDALKRIAQLNDLLKKGAINAQQYHDALGKIGASSVTKAPEYQGPDAVVGGAFGELQKNSKALADLEAWHQSVLAANASFHATNAAEEEAYQSRMASIEQTYSAKRVAIEKTRGMLTMQASEEAFGQLAALTSSSNHTLAAIGRASAITQAALSLAINVAKASEVGFPLNIGFIAGALAQGTQIAELINQAGSGGYSEGGYTGPGGVNQPAGIVHAGEVVWSQADVRRAGGVGIVEGMRLRGYADGGVVSSPFSNVPSPADLGFTRSSMPSMDMRDFALSDAAQARAQAPQDIKVVVLMDKDAVADEVMNSPTGQKVIVRTVGDNPTHIQGSWGRG